MLTIYIESFEISTRTNGVNMSINNSVVCSQNSRLVNKLLIDRGPENEFAAWKDARNETARLIALLCTSFRFHIWQENSCNLISF